MKGGLWSLAGTGRGTMRGMVEGALLLALTVRGRAQPMNPSTTPLRVGVPLPVPGRLMP